MPNPTALPEIHTSRQDDLTPLYHVVLLDDDEHTYDYVVEMLGSIFCLSADTAYRYDDVVVPALVPVAGQVGELVLAVILPANLANGLFETAHADELMLAPAGLLGIDFEGVGDKNAFDCGVDLPDGRRIIAHV